MHARGHKVSFTLAMLLLVNLTVSGQAKQTGKQIFFQIDGEPSLPTDLAWIVPFTAKIQTNSQGYWEVELKNGIEMIYVPAGEFFMGSPKTENGRESDEGPVHRVFTKGVWMGKYEVTRAIWQAVMGGREVGFEERNLPKGDVTFYEVQEFLRVIHKKSGLRFRLPTEAEWEKCCRGGTLTPQYASLDDIAWHIDNSGEKPHPVGARSPNAFGLFDMLGNVWEWCSDWYGTTYYKDSNYFNPTGPETGTRRICRGGGFRHGGSYLRSAHRNDQDPARSKPYLGFRLVLDAQTRKSN